MRVFLAIALPDDIRGNLIAAIKRLAPIATDVKWSTRDQLHLTLAFLGEVSPAIVPHVTAAAERVCAVRQPFVCQAYGLGYFGTKRNPKTLWASITPTGELDDLHEAIWLELEKFGYEKDKMDFRPHITLGRCREAARNHTVISAMDAEEDIEFGEWEVKRVTLYDSRMTPHGPVYRTLSNTALPGA